METLLFVAAAGAVGGLIYAFIVGREEKSDFQKEKEFLEDILKEKKDKK